MSMIWPLRGCAPASAGGIAPPGRHFRDCVLSATLVIRFSQKSAQEDLDRRLYTHLCHRVVNTETDRPPATSYLTHGEL